MEIGKFKLAKADLVRPPNKPAQEQIIPKQKPYTEGMFKKEADLFLKGFIGGFPKDEMILKIQSVLDKAVDAGAIEPQEGIKYLRERKQQLVDFARENYGQELPGIEDRENFSQGSGGGRKKVEIPGLEEKTIELFEQNLSNNQVLKALKEFPEFKDTTIGVIKRIKKENNLGGQRKELFKSQEDKYKKLKTLVEESNNSPVLTKMKTLREKVGLPANTAPSDFKNYEKFDIPKLEKAPEKVKKEFIKIIDNPNIPVEDVFDVSSTLAKRIGTSVQTVGEVLNTMPEYQDFKPTARKLQNPYFKSGVMNKGKTLADVLEMSENIGPSSGYVSMGNTPERFILNSITRHINQGGDKVEWVKPPSDLVSQTEAVFRYKGKDYNYYDLVQNGRKIDDFKEVYKSFDELNNLLSRETIDPVTKQKTSFKDLMKEAYQKGAGYGEDVAPYEIDHFGSVKNEPFSNLRVLPRRINSAAGAITSAAQRATTGVFTQKGKDWTPAKSKEYLKKSGYNFTKDMDKLFNDEVKLANDILVKDRKLRSVVDIGKEAVNKKFTKLLDIEGITTADKLNKPPAAVERDMFKKANERFKNQKGVMLGSAGDLDTAARLVKEDFQTAKKLFGEYAPQIARASLPAIKLLLAETGIGAAFVPMDIASGLTTKEVLTNLATLGVGVPFKDIQERGKFVEEKGLGPALQSALRKKMIPQNIRPALNLPVDFGKPQQLTEPEQQAMQMFETEAKEPIESRRKKLAEERVEKYSDPEFGFRGGAMNGGIMRLGFADGPKDPTKRKFIKAAAGIASIPILGRFIKPATKAIEAAAPAIQKSVEGIPDFLTDLIAKIKLKAEATGMKYFTGNRSDEFTDVYQADNFIVKEKGNKITLREVDDPDRPGYRENEIELEVDPETGGVTYKEASVRPDDEGKLKDVEEYIDEEDLENMRKYTYDE
jgi:hypothetical protein